MAADANWPRQGTSSYSLRSSYTCVFGAEKYLRLTFPSLPPYPAPPRPTRKISLLQMDIQLSTKQQM